MRFGPRIAMVAKGVVVGNVEHMEQDHSPITTIAGWIMRGRNGARLEEDLVAIDNLPTHNVAAIDQCRRSYAAIS